MRLPAFPRWAKRLRLRLRMLMIVVAVLAVGLALKTRRDHCLERAGSYGEQSRRYERLAEIEDMQVSLWRNSMGPEVSPPVRIDMQELGRKEASRDAYREHSRLYDATRLRFEEAAANPFLPLPPESGRSK